MSSSVKYLSLFYFTRSAKQTYRSSTAPFISPSIKRKEKAKSPRSQTTTKKLNKAVEETLQNRLTEALVQISTLETELDTAKQYFSDELDRLKKEAEEIKDGNENESKADENQQQPKTKEEYLRHIELCRKNKEWIANLDSYKSQKPFSKTMVTHDLKPEKYRDLECLEYPWSTQEETILKRELNNTKKELAKMNAYCDDLTKQIQEKDEIIAKLQNQ